MSHQPALLHNNNKQIKLLTAISYAQFGGLVIKSFGFTTLQTTLLQCPTGLVEIGALIVFTTASIYIPHSRLALGALASSTALAGTVMLYALPLENKWGLVTGYVLSWDAQAKSASNY